VKRPVKTDRPHVERDEHELKLLEEALKLDIPVLAVCRGHQLLNVALGGSLLQNIEEDGHKWTPEGDSSWHDISVDPDSHLARAFANGNGLHVNSPTGDTVDRLAEDCARPLFA
jgi:putative glutamine amidotransferase